MYLVCGGEFFGETLSVSEVYKYKLLCQVAPLISTLYCYDDNDFHVIHNIIKYLPGMDNR